MSARVLLLRLRNSLHLKKTTRECKEVRGGRKGTSGHEKKFTKKNVVGEVRWEFEFVVVVRLKVLGASESVHEGPRQRR